ncbi:conserved hypothetical protein [Trichinella spiralis]|uniref:hypothetical protein n=1 Tax=Trichinella spiralis TaxID=6334 RepID=UPI0001EFE85A|nr:conserved hypothetical protein [Trichinella spiralis]
MTRAFGYIKRVIVTPAVYPRLIEFLHFDIQSTGQKSHCVITDHRPSQCFIPCVRASSKLAVECRPKRSVHENGQPRSSGSARAGLSASSASDSNTLDQPNNRWQVNKSSTQLSQAYTARLKPQPDRPSP